jgi:copper oxidase (laccase) domain-containing protein
VGNDVAAKIEAAAGCRLCSPGPRGRPHLDLVGAVGAQLRQRGLNSIRKVSACTRCQVGKLASYRRDGKGAGRNIALAWLKSTS